MENYRCVTSVQEIQQYIGNAAVVAFDYETAPGEPYRIEEKAALDPAKSHIVGCSFSAKEPTLPEDLCYVYGVYLEDYLHDVEICQRFARRSRVSSPPESTAMFFSQVSCAKPIPDSTFLMLTSML